MHSTLQCPVGRPACKNAFQILLTSGQAGLPAKMHSTLQWPVGGQAAWERYALQTSRLPIRLIDADWQFLI
jgi:hypothetical protein